MEINNKDAVFTESTDENEQENTKNVDSEFVTRLDSHASLFEEASCPEKNQFVDEDFQCGNVDDPSFKPVIGREFSTHEEAYEFYNGYAKLEGFKVRKHSTLKSKKTKELITRIYVCCKEGFKKSVPQSAGTSQVQCKRETRVGCNARMIIGPTGSGTWIIKGFQEKHNHELTSLSKVMEHHSHRQFHCTDNLHDQELAPSRISNDVNVLSGGLDIVPLQQCHDHLRVDMQNNIGRECIAVINHFQNKRATDPEFYFNVEIDEDKTLKSIFWADGRARTSYLKFSDVLVFDVTYKTNHFMLPFAPFTGVNHHRQSILFGCALLADEKEETFIWLFQTLLQCMCGVAPRVVITDQDMAISNAIQKVFPETVHRYCSWHLNEHVAEHLQPIRTIYGDKIDVDFKKLKYSNTIEECEQFWNELKIKYNIDENSWLGNMYKKRHHWIPVYLKDIFFAGMISSQRSESMNSYFDDFVNAQTRPHEFIHQYDLALFKHRGEEAKADFATKNSMPDLISGHPFEAQGRSWYTKNIFNIFLKEIQASNSCIHNKLYKEGNITKYEVGKFDEDKSVWKIVTYDANDGVKAKCSCGKFEFMGILCRHIIRIMTRKQVTIIPECYVLYRWTINARYVAVDDAHGIMGENNSVTPVMNWRLRVISNELLEQATGSIDLYKEVSVWMLNKLKAVRSEERANIILEVPVTSQVGSFTTCSETREQTQVQITICDPVEPIKRKGRLSSTSQFESELEISQAEKLKKQRTCGNCGGKIHYRTSCPNPKINVGDMNVGEIGPSASQPSSRIFYLVVATLFETVSCLEILSGYGTYPESAPTWLC